jgi:hypothetical protein
LRRSSPEFDLALDFERLALLGTEWLELLVALLEFLEVGGRDGRTNAEGDAMVILPGLALVSAGAFTTASVAILVPAPQRISAVGRAPKTPTLLDVLGVRGRLKLQNHERALPRVLDSKLRVTTSPTRIVGGGTMSKRNLIIEEGSVEAMARLQKQDEEFCRRLRAAIETGRERCPTTVFTEACTNRPVSNYMRPD